MLQYRVVTFCVFDSKHRGNKRYYDVYDAARFVAGPFATKKHALECQTRIYAEFDKLTDSCFLHVPNSEDRVILQNQIESKVLQELEEHNDFLRRKKLNPYKSPTLH